VDDGETPDLTSMEAYKILDTDLSCGQSTRVWKRWLMDELTLVAAALAFSHQHLRVPLYAPRDERKGEPDEDHISTMTTA